MRVIVGAMMAIIVASVAATATAAQDRPGAKPRPAATAPAGGRTISPALLAQAFGRREDVAQASLSPDGRHLAIVASGTGQGGGVLIYDLQQAGGGTPRGILKADGDPERIQGCRWASNDRLLCTVYGITKIDGMQIAYTSRMIGLDRDGGGMKALPMPSGRGLSLFGGDVLDWNPGEDGKVLMVRDRLATATTGSHIGSENSGLGVDLVDTRTMRATVVERGNADSSEYISDGRGTVRITARMPRKNGYIIGGRSYMYRQPGSREWQPLSRVDADGNGFDPYGVDPERNLAYGLKKIDGRKAAVSIALDGSLRETVVYRHPQVDVSGFTRIGRNGRIVGATFSTDTPGVHYFDPALAKLTASLARALPRTPLIRFIDSSEDEQRLLLWAGADTDPGRFYLFDRKAGTLSPLIPDRMPLEGVTLATMRPITYPATDGTGIPGYLTLPPGKESAKGLPALVMPHGGPGARDEWGFDWLAQYFAARGYAVLQPNFRGSTGYGDVWFQKNGFQSWRTAIGDVNDAGRWLVKEGIADPRRLGVFGWSYGGYAALQSQVVDPALFKAVVAVAPVTDLGKLVTDARNFSNYTVVAKFVGSGPHVAQGSPARFASRFAAPVLMFHGTYDNNVDVAHAQLMNSRLKGAGKASELVIYPKLDHYLEDSTVRADMLTKASAFLETAMK